MGSKISKNWGTTYTTRKVQDNDLVTIKQICTNEKGHLSFMLNGDDLGVAFYDVDCNYHLTMYIRQAGDGVTIL